MNSIVLVVRPPVAQKAIDRVREVASDLRHPRTVWVHAYASNLDLAGLQLDDKQDHVTDRSREAQDFYGKEIARIQRVPVGPHELLPRSLLFAFRSRNDAKFIENIRHRIAANITSSRRAGETSRESSLVGRSRNIVPAPER